MWQAKYASAILKHLGVGLNYRPCSEDYFLFGRPWSVGLILFQSLKPSKLSYIFIGQWLQIHFVRGIRDSRVETYVFQSIIAQGNMGSKQSIVATPPLATQK